MIVNTLFLEFCNKWVCNSMFGKTFTKIEMGFDEEDENFSCFWKYLA